MRRALPVLLVLGGLFIARAGAGEVQKASVDRRKGEYFVDVEVKVSGNKNVIYNIATDYQKLSRLNKLIVESGLVHRIAPDGTSVIRRRLITRTCVMKLCFNATLIEDVWEPASGIIRTVFVPEESDFVSGEAIWQITRIDADNTLIDFHSRFRPAFWVPPLVGPYFIRRMMLDAAKETILNIEQLAAVEKSAP